MLFPILFLVLCVGLARGNSTNSDIEALLDFKKGISRESMVHDVLDSWDHFTSASEGCPRNWFGVQCSGDRVTAISLNGIGLVGNISLSSLSQMDMLHNLSLANNQLTGILSPEMGAISSLEYLDLSKNSFIGLIPEELLEMSNLAYLNLSCNNFGAMVPSGLNRLEKLKYLDLHANNFFGDVGDILGQLGRAVYVDLSLNRLTGALRSISDSSSAITISLQYLNISHNGLSGQLFGNDLVPLFDTLEVFDASFNRINGQVPSFNFIVSLKILRLGNNLFSGSFPEALFKDFSTVLAELDLSCNKLTGPLPSITSSTLKKLNLSTNKLTGSLPTKIGSCIIVDLSNNLFSGNISSIRSWGNYVEDIDISSNRLKGTLLNETSLFLRLKSLKLSNNLLEGELPLVIGTYPEISVINLSRNRLYGSLPGSLFTSASLMDLNLSGNSLSGPIFPEERNAKSASLNSSLASIDLSNNKLSGFLSQEIGGMRQLRLLNISWNNISGHIPRNMGMLQGLLYMDLSHNQFEGIIPDNLPDGLLGFYVSYNNLSGNVPNNLLTFPDSSFHPGNALLILPPTFLNVPSVIDKGKQHRRRMKSAIIYGLIAGAFAFSLLILLFILVCRSHSLIQSKSRISLFLRPCKSLERPPTSSNLSQDHLVLSRSSLAQPEQGIAAPGSGENPETVRNSVSLIINSPSTIRQSSRQNPNVHSPDRLAGDLHLFDNLVVFTLEELSRAPAEIIGRSCHGTTYKAALDNGHILAVKWLKEGIVKSKKEFSREAKKLGSMRHPNLVSLKGYYWGPKEHERLLVSYSIDALSLTHLLHSQQVPICRSAEIGQRRIEPLSLSQRLTVATDIACCLNYLHNERSIPHGNLKSTNILIQPPNMNALLTDYSLHRIMNPTGMAEQVLNAGALGYRPPEFASTAKPCPSLKSDVYAYGVILLELLTGRIAGEIVFGNPGVVDLTDWVRMLARENRAYECFDKNAIRETEGPHRALEELLGVALRCIRSADERPEIKTVFEDLSSM